MKSHCPEGDQKVCAQMIRLFRRGSNVHCVTGGVRLMSAILLACSIGSVAVAAPADVSDRDSAEARPIVKGVRWGATEAEISAQEAQPPKSSTVSGAERIVIFPGTLLGEQISTVYRFIGGKLFHVEYRFEAKGRGCAELKARFDRLVGAIAEEIGEGHQSVMPAASSQCNMTEEWSGPERVVSVNLSGESGKNDLAVSIESPNVGELATHTSTRVVPRVP